ncbi:portal protein [Candidatus Tisiphia endosymbiont of Dioctria rufipes]|uniref:portal protein n=1 Tax=Candidatus Tisiphia endosymbiont of Dioctria rufipes TaxID=3066255 RepID=UPI003977A7C6
MHIVSPVTSTSSSLLPYSSEYIHLAEQKIISQSGYSYFPFFVTRWIKEEGQVYGYAPQLLKVKNYNILQPKIIHKS